MILYLFRIQLIQLDELRLWIEIYCLQRHKHEICMEVLVIIDYIISDEIIMDLIEIITLITLHTIQIRWMCLNMGQKIHIIEIYM